MKLFRALIAVALVYSLPAWPGPVELSDVRGVMTCEYYHAGVRLGWERQGGDWRDARDVAYGDSPFTRTTVAKSRKMQAVEWDVTSLARKWQDGTRPGGGIYLRQLAAPTSSVKFRSREAKDPATHPSLLIEWTDGSLSELRPSADTTITCTSGTGKGKKKYLEVGNGRSTILVFPFEVKRGARVRTARLVMHSRKQYGSPSDIGVYQLSVPFTRQAKPRDGLAAGFRADADITSHPAVVFATGFESSNWLDEWSARKTPKNAAPISDDPDNLFTPLDGNALKVTIRKGKKGGLNLLYRFKEKLGSEPEAMYFRYYLRLGDNWKPKVSGKMPGLSGTYNVAGWGGRRSDGTNGWSARGRYSVSRALADGEYSLGSYAYHAGMKKKYGSGWGWGLGPTGVIKRNRWYSVEQYVKLNTPGKSDGELKAWLDGVLIFDRKGLRYRDVSDLRIETLWMNVYHGGIEKAPRDISLYIDNVVIARDYIGPASELSPGE